MIAPNEHHAQLPLTQNARRTIARARQTLIDILQQKDDRFMVIAGPCSIHNPESALSYAKQLARKSKEHQDTLCIVMRAYIEKSRTALGWKGLLNDPELNNTFSIEKGLTIARSLLIAINELGVPTAAEIVNPLTAPYFLDTMSWVAIGARTTESQLHRELASQLAIPVGFKNTTSGNIQAAIDAIETAAHSHHFLGLNEQGKISIQQSRGNPYAHLVLRGAHHHSNYDSQTIALTTQKLRELSLISRVLIDCSHGNSQKNPEQQKNVVHTLAHRIEHHDDSILGVMLESHLIAGKQLWSPQTTLLKEQSITDACIGWNDTEILLDALSAAVQKRRAIVIE